MPLFLQAEKPLTRAVAAQTEDSPAAPGGFNPTTLVLLLVAAAFFWWSMRRRRVAEERLREQRRQETITHAEQSAQNVANIMRSAPPPGAAAAAAAEGLASAARMPAAHVAPLAEPIVDSVTDNGASTEAALADARDGARAEEIERAAAAALAERTAADEARRAAHAAALAGESEARRLAAAAAAADEARADTADAMRARTKEGASELHDREREGAEALRAGLRELDNEVEAPLGAIAGDGTPHCPPNFPIKGNAQSHIYHEPGQVSYPPTVPEFCFASAEAAEAAGFRQSRARGQRAQE